MTQQLGFLGLVQDKTIRMATPIAIQHQHPLSVGCCIIVRHHPESAIATLLWIHGGLIHGLGGPHRGFVTAETASSRQHNPQGNPRLRRCPMSSGLGWSVLGKVWSEFPDHKLLEDAGNTIFGDAE